MITVDDANNLYLKAKARSDDLVKSMKANWLSPVTDLMMKMMVQQVLSNPRAAKEMRSNPELSKLADKYGG